MKTTRLDEDRQHAKVLYYGIGGTAKTTSLATLANFGRVLYVDAESGLLKDPLEDLGVKTQNIERLGFDEISTDLDEAFWTIKEDLADDPDSWVGVVWDSGTEIYQAALTEIVGRRVEKAKAVVAQRGKASVAPSMLNPYFVDQDNYGEANKMLRSLMRHFRDLPCHFGSAFLERRDQDDKTKIVTIGPSISPGIQGDMQGWHDLVGRTSYDSDADLFLGRFRPEGVAFGKDRYHKVPALMVEPTFERIIGYLRGDLSEATDPLQARLGERVEEPETEPEDGDGEPAAESEGTAAPQAKRPARSRVRASAGRK